MLKEIVFEWDRWNIQKNELKHGVSSKEAESTFFDSQKKIVSDDKHSTPGERRFVLFGKSLEGRVLMVGFTVRNEKVRIITARPASRRERAFYET